MAIVSSCVHAWRSIIPLDTRAVLCCAGAGESSVVPLVDGIMESGLCEYLKLKQFDREGGDEGT